MKEHSGILKAVKYNKLNFCSSYPINCWGQYNEESADMLMWLTLFLTTGGMGQADGYGLPGPYQCPSLSRTSLVLVIQLGLIVLESTSGKEEKCLPYPCCHQTGQAEPQ